MRGSRRFPSSVELLGLLVLVTATSAGCESSTVTCPPGERLEDGQCVPIECLGGTIVGDECVCPSGQVYDAGRCRDICEGVSCDDENECTIDGQCDPDKGGCPAAIFEPAGAPCMGDRVCDGSGACVLPDPSCVPNPCEDEDGCTRNVCRAVGTEGTDCTYPLADIDTPCSQDEGRFCDVTGHCVDCNHAGQCDDGNPCTRDECRGNACTSVPSEPGVACGEGDIGFCDGDGNCVDCGKSADCPGDGNPCTTAICDAWNCVSIDVPGSCELDGGAGVCDNGTCVAGQMCDPYPCEERGPCVDSDCEPSNGACEYHDAPNGRSCSTGGPSGECIDGVCELCAVLSCEDGNPCTIDGTCNPVTGICDGSSDSPAGTPCGSGLCDGSGSCVECTSPEQCADGNPCTADECAGNTCVNIPVEWNASCDQPNGGFCDGTGNCLECNTTSQCSDDGNVCTVPICNAGNCELVDVPDSCNYMGQAGVCQSGTCVDANMCDPYPCNTQGRPCIVDTCNPTTGACSFANAATGTTCTESGQPGECAAGVCDVCAPVNCDDGNPCTIDGTCNSSNGQCSAAQNIADGVSCGGTARVCSQGTCITDTLGWMSYTGSRTDLTDNRYAAVVRTPDYPWGHSGFYFDYDGPGGDTEVDRIASGWFNSDFAGPMQSVAWAVLWDDGGEDDYDYRFNSTQLPLGSIIYSTSGSSNGGEVRVPLRERSNDYWPALLGFDIDRSREGELKQLAVMLMHRSSDSHVQLLVRCADEREENPFTYSVRYAWIPINRIIEGVGIGAYYINSSPLVVPISTQRPLLKGFRLEYSAHDHRVDRIGVRLDPGNLTFWLDQQTDEDVNDFFVGWLSVQ